MKMLGPFEFQPHLAVAVSGGGDSMALVLLADDWARSQGGRITALTVDHGLRANSASEAAQVGKWLQAKGIAHTILSWTGPKPGTGVQQAAREVRYALMSAWCRDQGVLHLALAHNMEDQAETYLMRLGRGSGADGLAAMSECVELLDVRLLRPLLDVPREDLRNLLEAAGQDWIDDPSNLNTAYARIRVRALLSPLAGAGVTAERLAQAAARYGLARVTLENQTARLLAECAGVFPAGCGYLKIDLVLAADREIAYRALSRMISCIGGRRFGPSVEKLARLYDGLTKTSNFKGTTLAGCRIIPSDRELLICREVRAGVPSLRVQAGETFQWDRRFEVTLDEVGKGDDTGSLQLTFLGEQGWQAALQKAPELAAHPMPHAVKISLPALLDDHGIHQIPHLGYLRHTRARQFVPTPGIQNIHFCPPNTASFKGFFLA